MANILPIVRLLSAVFYDYRDRMDKSIKFCMDMLQDLLNQFLVYVWCYLNRNYMWQQQN